MFDIVMGLPAHPLIVHAAVVLLPLSALSLVAAYAVPWWRSRFSGVSLIGLTLATAAALAAKESGEALAARVGEPRQHEEWAEILIPVAVVLWLLAVVWYVLHRMQRRVLTLVAGGAMTIAAVASLVLIGLVGHSGAQATWAGEVAPQSTQTATKSADDDATESAGTSASPSSGASAAAGTAYTLAQVQQHASATSCWSAVNGQVYDLTAWIPQHPGGAAVIEGLCGKDGTAAFTKEHGSAAKPNEALAKFRIGTLAG